MKKNERFLNLKFESQGFLILIFSEERFMNKPLKVFDKIDMVFEKMGFIRSRQKVHKIETKGL